MAAERPDTFNAYQQSQQNSKVEGAFKKASYISSLIGHESGKALFVGLFRRGDWRQMGCEEYWNVPAYKEMKAFGMQGFTGARETVLWFELEPTDFYSKWKGRLIVEWPGLERSWWRWADRNVILIDSILERSALDAEMPSWEELALTWEELKVLPSKWKAALSEWRGHLLHLGRDRREGIRRFGLWMRQHPRALAELRLEWTRRKQRTSPS